MDHSSDRDKGEDLGFMKQALQLALLSPPKQTNFCVGAVLVGVTSRQVIATGYTLELLGNTHAEECCLQKLAASPLNSLDLAGLDLYTTMEPCNWRASGKQSCTERILANQAAPPQLRIRAVYVGVSEPETFVAINKGRALLEAAGIRYVHVSGLEQDILQAATAGHVHE